MTAVLERVKSPTLEELAAIANREHEMTVSAAEDMLAHAIQAGEALLEARTRVQYGEWVKWQEQHLTCSRGAAMNYVRLAFYKREVLASGAVSIQEGLRLLKGSPMRPKTGFDERYARNQEAKRMREAGWTTREIAAAMGLNVKSIYRVLEPEKYRASERRAARNHMRRRAAEQKALKDQERALRVKEALRTAPDALGRAFSLASKLDQELGRAREQATTREQRVAVIKAHEHRDQMMADLLEALGVS